MRVRVVASAVELSLPCRAHKSAAACVGEGRSKTQSAIPGLQVEFNPLDLRVGKPSAKPRSSNVGLCGTKLCHIPGVCPSRELSRIPDGISND